MANEYFCPRPRSHAGRSDLLLPSLAFVALLLLVFVGLDAFSPPLAVSQFGGVSETSRGDVLRQILYLSRVRADRAGRGAAARLRRALRAIPVSMGLLLAWCVASALWADEPGVALRRAGLEVMLVLSLLLSVDTIGAERAFRFWRIVLAGDPAGELDFHSAGRGRQHLPGEIDPALVGNWRGLYGHKNIAGAVCAMTAILFLFSRNGRRNWIGIVVALAACVFLVMTHSKTSLGILPLALAAGCDLPLRLARQPVPRHPRHRRDPAAARAWRLFVLLDADAIAPCAGRPRRIHRPRRDLGGGTALYPRSSPAGRGLRHLRRYRRPVAAA